MSISIKLLESDSVIKNKINNAIAQELNVYIKNKIPQLTSRIKDLTISVMASSPEIKELQFGKLKADFGLTSDPTYSIINSIAQTLKITTSKVTASGRTIKGGLKVFIQPTNYANLYSLAVSQQVIRNGSLPWLKWLLEAGDSVLIVDFGVEYGPFGRTGLARMTESNRPFKVDSNYSGISGDNFISRAFEANDQYFKKTIIQVMQ
jgi:hypothetical protein